MKYLLFAATIFCCAPVIASDSLIFLMDTSGSMGEIMTAKDKNGKSIRIKSIDAAKESMIKVIDNIAPDTTVGLLTFDGWTYAPQKVDKAKLVKAIQSMTPSGGTPLGQFMKTAADQLLNNRIKGDRGGTYTMIVVTDGEAGDQHLVDRYLPDIINRGLIIKAIGLDLPKSHSLATLVNEYTNANDPTALETNLKKYVAEVSFKNSSTQGDDVFDELKPLPNEVAYAVIQEMTEQRNHPIGEEPMVRVKDESGKTVSVPNQPNASIAVNKDNGLAGLLAVICVGFVIIIFMFGVFKRGL